MREQRPTVKTFVFKIRRRQIARTSYEEVWLGKLNTNRAYHEKLKNE